MITDNPKLEYLVGANKFRLLEDYVTEEITVPAGFVTDGASTGRLLQTLFPSFYKYFPAAIVHDYCYEIKNGKEKADKLFKSNMQKLGLSARYWWPMYWAVRLFGKSHY